MSSPVFGSNNNSKMFKATPRKKQSTFDVKYVQQAIVMMHVQKNIRKMIFILTRMISNRKRACFHCIKNREILPAALPRFTQPSKAALLFHIQRKILLMVSILSRANLKNKLNAWKQINYVGSTQVKSQGNRVRTVYNELKQQNYKPNSYRVNKWTQQWKQNSSTNQLDLPSQNKQLRVQIQKQQNDQQSFLTKMNTLLDSFEKPKMQSKKKK